MRYALKDSDRPIGLSTYRIVSKLPQELKGQLTNTEQVAKLLEELE